MVIYYCRVSTADQNLDRQLEAAKRAGAGKVYAEAISGKDTNRPELKKMLEFAREGDVVRVESISRLARSVRDLLVLVDKLEDAGVAFVSEKENIDTQTPQGRFMLTVFAALSELEREQTLERQAEGIKLAKTRGVYTGRKKITVKIEEFQPYYEKWKNGTISSLEFREALNLKPNTFYRRIKEYEGAING